MKSTIRNCMKCGNPFRSWGLRFCKTCQTKNRRIRAVAEAYPEKKSGSRKMKVKDE